LRNALPHARGHVRQFLYRIQNSTDDGADFLHVAKARIGEQQYQRQQREQRQPGE